MVVTLLQQERYDQRNKNQINKSTNLLERSANLLDKSLNPLEELPKSNNKYLTKLERSQFTINPRLKENLIGLILGYISVCKQKTSVNARLKSLSSVP